VPRFVAASQPQGSGELVVAGVTSRGAFFCPANSQGIYTSAVERSNSALITATTRTWLGASEEIVPGRCPVTFCCYAMECAATGQSKIPAALEQ